MSPINGVTSPRSLLALAAVLLGCAIWLLTSDVFADEGPRYVGEPAPEDASLCGSAYDVALLEGDGFMGGEVAENQRAIDQQCTRKAARSVALGSALGSAAFVQAGYGFGRSRRTARTTARPALTWRG